MEYATNGSLGNTTTAYSFGVQRESFVETTAGMGAGATIGGMTYQSSGTYYYSGTGSVANVTGTATNQSYSYTTGGSMTAFAMSASVGMTSDGITGTLTTNPTAYGTYGVYGYNGEYTHTNLGLQYLRARYLNVATGTFTSKDTYAGRLQDILSQNRYTYAENNPVGHSDPSGHAVKSGMGAAITNAFRNSSLARGKNAREATQAAVSAYANEQKNRTARENSNRQFINNVRNAAYTESAIRVGVCEYSLYGLAVLSSNYGAIPMIDRFSEGMVKANCAAYDYCINGLQEVIKGKDAGRIAYGSGLILEGIGKAYGAAGLAKASTMVSATGVGTAIGIGGFAASAWLMACASADITQGAMEVYYGFKGDSLTPTVHVVKDSPIYGSNDLAYHLSTNVAAGLGETAGALAVLRQPIPIKPDESSTNMLRQMAELPESGSNSDELIHVYRGTDKYAEIAAYNETGQLMSDATRNLYFETGNLDAAYVQSGAIHDNWLNIWGNQNDYVQAHGAFGTELSQAFGLDRTFVSVTTDPDVARRFAGANGQVFEAYIPKSQLIEQTLEGAGESEYLIKFGAGGFK